MIKINAANQKVMAWKNGGGKTREIAIYPANANLETFDWRISTAQVDQGGPFSLFPGADRSLALLSGTGLALSIGRRKSSHLTMGSSPVSFSGEDEVVSTLADGTVSDFNVMTRRNRCSHTVTLMRVNGKTEISRMCDILIMYLPESGIVHYLTRQGERVELCQGDAVVIDESDSNELTLFSSAPKDIYVTRISWKTD